jgi:D-arabinose 1-dehydrogenase-like Zn-dependent alcohol dehydrogenase
MSTEIRRDENNTPKSMKAARVTQFGKPLEFQDVDVPQPGPGEVLVKVRVCGICHTDLHMRKGDLSNAPELPQTMGHEGTVTAAFSHSCILVHFKCSPSSLR